MEQSEATKRTNLRLLVRHNQVLLIPNQLLQEVGVVKERILLRLQETMTPIAEAIEIQAQLQNQIAVARMTLTLSQAKEVVLQQEHKAARQVVLIPSQAEAAGLQPKVHRVVLTLSQAEAVDLQPKVRQAVLILSQAEAVDLQPKVRQAVLILLQVEAAEAAAVRKEDQDNLGQLISNNTELLV